MRCGPPSNVTASRVLPQSWRENQSHIVGGTLRKAEQVAEFEGEDEKDNVGAGQVEEEGGLRQQGVCLDRSQEGDNRSE